MRIVFLSAENGALKGAKVGGVGDVVGRLPAALALLGCEVTVVVPSYGFLHHRPGSRKAGSVPFGFGGIGHTAELYRVPADVPHPGVHHVVVDHPILASRDPDTGRLRIYAHDAPDRPFATDATRFACFSAAAAAAVCEGLLGDVDGVHLHDWHTALLAFLRKFSPDCSALKGIRTVYTIHNLSLQGVRPAGGDASSLAAWFPGLNFDPSDVMDPRWPNCVNLMKIGIRLADAVHAVSPSYAREIQAPSDPPAFYGGEGLETVLGQCAKAGRLTGILNGCDYPNGPETAKPVYPDLLERCRSRVVRWAWSGTPWVAPAHFLAHGRLIESALQPERPDVLITCVSRVVEQKMLLMCASGADGRPALERILEAIGDGGRLMLLGTGDPRWERRLLDIASKNDNFVFLNGYSDACAGALYACGDLFLMPSSFEPCGIGQMLAMREGQPCVVHSVGGLRDTVENGVNGFCFTGGTVAEQADAFVETTLGALALRREHPDRWRRIRRRAADARFPWSDTAKACLARLYRPIGSGDTAQ